MLESARSPCSISGGHVAGADRADTGGLQHVIDQTMNSAQNCFRINRDISADTY